MIIKVRVPEETQPYVVAKQDEFLLVVGKGMGPKHEDAQKGLIAEFNDDGTAYDLWVSCVIDSEESLSYAYRALARAVIREAHRLKDLAEAEEKLYEAERAVANLSLR